MHNTLGSNGHLDTSRKKFMYKEIGKEKVDLYSLNERLQVWAIGDSRLQGFSLSGFFAMPK